jgi:hypothetical protein
MAAVWEWLLAKWLAKWLASSQWRTLESGEQQQEGSEKWMITLRSLDIPRA